MKLHFDKSSWCINDAVELCKLIERICPKFGCHVALTGGTLYKEGERKDLDLVFYRIRQEPKIDIDGLWQALALIDVIRHKGGGWIHKATYFGKNIDMFFPEEQGGEYVTKSAAETLEEQKLNNLIEELLDAKKLGRLNIDSFC